MLPVPFAKLQGLGNNFVLVHEPAAPGLDWSALAPDICAHHFGVGADGLLVVSPSEAADVRMRYFDPDGSEDMCGNGLRCVVRWSHYAGVAPREMRVQTLAGVRTCEALPDGLVKAEMGAPILDAARLPARIQSERMIDYPITVNGRTYAVTGISFGTTHAVIIDHDRYHEHWDEDSAALEVHEVFPERTTVDWVEVVGRDRVLMRPWERRLGETLACGTGACSSAVVMVLHGLTDRIVTVEMRGGELRVEWGEDDEVVATGGAEIVYEGTYFGAR